MKNEAKKPGESNREYLKREARQAQKRKTMTRRAVILGGASVVGLGAIGYLATQANDGGNNPALPTVDTFPGLKDPLSITEVQDVTRQAIDDYESVLGVKLDKNLIVASTSLVKYDRTAVGLDRSKEALISAASTSDEQPPKISISSEFISNLPLNERKPMARALMTHELVHYDASHYQDLETSAFIFSKYEETSGGVEPQYVRGFKVVGKGTVDGKDWSVFSQLEEAAAFTIGNYTTIQSKALFPDNFYFVQQGFQSETACFAYVIEKLFPSFEEGMRTVAAIRQEPNSLSIFASLLGEKLGWDEKRAKEVGLTVLFSVNAGNLEAIKQGLG